MNSIKLRSVRTWPDYTIDKKMVEEDVKQLELATYVRFKRGEIWHKVMITEKMRLGTRCSSADHELLVMQDLYRAFLKAIHYTMYLYVPSKYDIDELQIAEKERLVLKHKYEVQHINPMELLGL